jgi:hypothetical protein
VKPGSVYEGRRVELLSTVLEHIANFHVAKSAPRGPKAESGIGPFKRDCTANMMAASQGRENSLGYQKGAEEFELGEVVNQSLYSTK